MAARLAIASIGMTLLGMTNAPADDFYARKTVTMIIGGGAGAGFDLYGRALARHYPNHIPGSPNIVVPNMPAARQKAIGTR